MKKDILEFKIFEQWTAANEQASRLEDIITSRITYIVHTLFNQFNMKLDTWYFSDAGEGQVGSLSDHCRGDEIDSIEVELNRDFVYLDINIIDRFGNEWMWENMIPRRWLFEDFEKEIADGKIKYLEKEVARKAKQKELSKKKKAEDALLIEKAKQKLSAKELAALKRNL